MIWTNCVLLNVWGGGDDNIGTNQLVKCGRSLLNPTEYRMLQYWHGTCTSPQNVLCHREMVWYKVLEIGSQ